METTSLQELLSGHFAAAIADLTGQPVAEVEAFVRPAGDPRFGDYQCNAAMALSRTLKLPPPKVAAKIKEAVEPRLAGMVESLEIAGPGFINIRISSGFLGQCLEATPAPPTQGVDRVGLPPVSQPLRVVVEYSQPNVAKQMHVGHLRTTIIGDVFARLLSFMGHDVVRQNHVGDWGTQFGMLIRWYREHPLPTPETHADVLEAIEADYKAANERFQADQQFATEARLAVAQLQSGDAEARRVWKHICALSTRAFTEIYERLGVLLRPEDVRGESFYNDKLPGIIAELRQRFGPDAAPANAGQGRAEVRDDQGAVVAYMYDGAGKPLFRNADGQPMGMIVQKSDGAFLYATTDLAAIRFRLRDLPFASGTGAQRIIYVTDARQRLHFQMFFALARIAGWIDPGVEVDHVTFGSVLGEDRRPLKTRTGGTIKLRELLEEAQKRALEVLRDREQPADDLGTDDAGSLPAETASRIGIAAVKYADLRNDRNGDYVFSWDRMLSLTGNTAPYMLYAYARIRSIYRKAAERFGSPDVYAPSIHLSLATPEERALGLRLVRLREALDDVAVNLTPHTLCTYLYDLAAEFMRFYETCPVLAAPDQATRHSRMRLCDLTARALRLGLGVLGIEAIERM